MPHVHDIKGIFEKHADVVDHVQELMMRYGVQDKLALFAFHKHFDVPAGHVLLLEKIDIAGGDRGEVVYPVPVSTLGHVHPVAYYVNDGRLQPYKYAKGDGPDLTPLLNFLHEFVEVISQLSVAHVFSIKLPNVSPHVAMAEAEIPEFGATALVPIKYFGEDYLPGSQAAAVFDACGHDDEHHGASAVKAGKHSVWVSGKTSVNPATAAAFSILEIGVQTIA